MDLTVDTAALPCVIVVFGPSGEFAKKKILPALWTMYREEVLPSNITFVGYSFVRSEMRIEMLQAILKQNCKVQAQYGKYARFLRSFLYVTGKYHEDDGFKDLNALVEGIEDKNGKPANRLFYLALPPTVFEPVTSLLKKHCMNNKGNSWSRVLIEKPFGHDTESSAKLSEHLAGLFKEEQIYRTDHYLGKEMVQNLMVLRFGNRLLGGWNRDNVASVMISFKEDFGTQGRAGYFDKSGIIRDVMQNHLMQILTLVAMEKPCSLEAEDIRNEKVKVLKSIAPVTIDDVVHGQYIANANSKHPEAAVGYLDEDGVPKDSVTPTYALAVLRVNNERWDGVPFFLRCGKGLNERKAEVRIQFREVPGDIFKNGELKRNELVIRVQPSEAVYYKMMTKTPGMGFGVDETELDLTYNDRYKGIRLPDAYERLFLEVINGSQINFVRTDELDYAWKIFTPLLKKIENEKIKPKPYSFGSRGPEEADLLMKKYGFVFTGTYKWTSPNKL
uniref:Glucose-6-phosphate 1-dehydrogenase n=1 Tax=Steinernema glaseri TaxID=37863 RepID=A0A1I7YKZ3_9BILA